MLYYQLFNNFKICGWQYEFSKTTCIPCYCNIGNFYKKKYIVKN